MSAKVVESFQQAIADIGLDTSGLRVEGFRTDGTSNYLANLNFRGQTWAAALRLPAKGSDVREFVSEKNRALVAVQYLLTVLGQGIEIAPDCILMFGGISCLVDGTSVQEFLVRQSSSTPLTLIDKIHGRTKVIAAAAYPSCLAESIRNYVQKYREPFYLSRGAPAWETLEECPQFERIVAQAVAALHLLTGRGTPVPFAAAQAILAEMKARVQQAATEWIPESQSKEETALIKSLSKWNAGKDIRRNECVRRERFLRTAVGNATCRRIFDNIVRRQTVSENALKSFCHGDCHGGNFIIVRYLYTLSKSEALVDRVFLNDIFEADTRITKVDIMLDEQNQCIEYGVAEQRRAALTAFRNLRQEIHIIDLDAGSGAEGEAKILHLYDAIVYAMSLENLTYLFAHPIPANEILSHYYEGLEVGK